MLALSDVAITETHVTCSICPPGLTVGGCLRWNVYRVGVSPTYPGSTDGDVKLLLFSYLPLREEGTSPALQ